MKNKKILILHSSNDLYGASKIFIQTCDLLHNANYEIHVMLPSKGPLDELINKNILINYHNLGVLSFKSSNFFINIVFFKYYPINLVFSL